ncbi:MAG: HD domain-containing protein [Myxococcales bacterium]|jgi:PAS domain S-box-containing protein
MTAHEVRAFPGDLRDPGVLITLLEQVPEGIVLTNARSEIIWANLAYCALMGASLDQMIGKSPRLFRSPQTSPQSIEQLWDSLACAGHAEARLVDRRGDGSEFHAALSIVRVDPMPGGAPHYLGVVRDVSLETAREAQLQRLAARADAARDTTIMALASMAEERDGNTGQHLQRVEAYCLAMARWIAEHAPERLAAAHGRDPETIARCAILHDIGKVGVPDAVLRKPGPLDPDEQEAMRRHPVIGAQMIDRVLAQQPQSDFLRLARDVVLHHHEAYDGSGYPHGLVGEAIPIVAQLTTVADVFDALTSARPYKPAHDLEASFQWIVQRSGTLFDPLVVQAFRAVEPSVREAHGRLADEASPSDRPIRDSGLRASKPLAVSRAGSTLSEALQLAADAQREDESLLAALRAFLQSGLSGELRLQRGDLQGRVDVSGTRVLWVHGCGEHPALGQRLVSEQLVSREALDVAVAACRARGGLLSEALLEDGRVGHVALREAVRRHLACKLTALRQAPGECVVTFSSGSRATTTYAFRLQELL